MAKLNLSGHDVRSKIIKNDLEKIYHRRIKKHNDLIASITKYWDLRNRLKTE